MGGILGSLAPIALSFLAPGIGTALGLSGIGGSLAGGAIAGGLGSAFGDGKVLKGALTGGLGGAAGNLLGQAGSSLLGGTSLGNSLGFSAPDGTSSFNDIISNNASNAGNLTGLTNNSGTGLFSGGGASSFGGNMGNNFKLGDLLGDINSYSAQDKIAKQQQDALNAAMSQFAPYQQTGVGANSQLSNLLGLNGASGYNSAMAALQNDPGYQFRLQQGQQGIDRNLSAQGLGQSGAAVKAANDYAQGQAQQEYQNAIQNAQGASNSGQNAAGALAGLATNLGQVGAARTGQQSNIINQGLSGLFGSGQNSTDQLLSQLMRRQLGLA